MLDRGLWQSRWWCGKVGGVTKWAAAWENGWRCGKGGSGGVMRGGSVERQQHHVPVGGVSTKKKNFKKGGAPAHVPRQVGTVFWMGSGIAI